MLDKLFGLPARLLKLFLHIFKYINWIIFPLDFPVLVQHFGRYIFGLQLKHLKTNQIKQCISPKTIIRIIRVINKCLYVKHLWQDQVKRSRVFWVGCTHAPFTLNSYEPRFGSVWLESDDVPLITKLSSLSTNNPYLTWAYLLSLCKSFQTLTFPHKRLIF